MTRLSCWLESEPCINLSAWLQTYLGCESVGTANEHKTATRIRPGSDQAYCHAESKTKSRDAKKGCQLPIRRKTGRDAVFPQTWAAVVASPAPQKSSRKQRTKSVNRDTGNIPAKQNSESEHYTHCDGPWRCCASTLPAVIPMIEGDLGELIARAVAAMTPLDALLKKVANKDHRDEKPGGHQRPRWNGRHLSCRCPDVTCLLYSCPCKHFSTAPCAWVVGCLCLESLLSQSFSMISFLRTTKGPTLQNRD